MKMIGKGMPFWRVALLFGVTFKDSCLPSLWESIQNDAIDSELCKAHYPGAGAWSAPGASPQKYLPVGQELNFLESFLLLIFGIWFWGAFALFLFCFWDRISLPALAVLELVMYTRKALSGEGLACLCFLHPGIKGHAPSWLISWLLHFEWMLALCLKDVPVF